jgi:hypothetical protein
MLHDPRLEKLADVLASYSTAVQQGDLIRLSGPLLGKPLPTDASSDCRERSR